MVSCNGTEAAENNGKNLSANSICSTKDWVLQRHRRKMSFGEPSLWICGKLVVIVIEIDHAISTVPSLSSTRSFSSDRLQLLFRQF